jgi:ABC-type nitrate/sulfonate/bicarbonate transport system substrate-binding protein
MKKKGLSMMLRCLSFVFVMIAVGVPGGFAEGATELFPLKVGTFGFHNEPGYPLIVGVQKGFFAEEGLEVTLVPTYQMTPGLIGKSLDLVTEAADTPILAVAKGADLVIVLDISHKPVQWLVLKKNIQSIKELEGKISAHWKIPSSDYITTRRFLASQGVDVNKITFRKVGGSRDRFAALQAGHIDAAPLGSQYAIKAQQEGSKVVATPADFGDFPWTYVVARREWARNHPDVVEKFLRAAYRSRQWIYDPANLDEAVKILSPITKSDEGTQRTSLEWVIEARIYAFEKPTAPMLKIITDWMLEEGWLKTPFDPGRILDTSYYERAFKGIK